MKSSKYANQRTDASGSEKSCSKSKVREESLPKGLIASEKINIKITIIKNRLNLFFMFISLKKAYQTSKN